MDQPNRYLQAAGLLSPADRVETALTVDGVLKFGLRKAPAVLGGMMARWLWRKAVKKWPRHPRGVDFVGSMAVIIASFGAGYFAARLKFSQDSTRFVDRLTDGMMGQVANKVWDLLTGLLPDAGGDSPRRLSPGPGPGVGGGAQPPANGVDGDEEAIRDVATLFANSPEMVRIMGVAMFDNMRQQGVTMDEGAREEIVRSMQQVSQNLADGAPLPRPPQ